MTDPVYIVTYINIDESGTEADFFDNEDELIDVLPEYLSESTMQIWKAVPVKLNTYFELEEEEHDSSLEPEEIDVDAG